MMYPNIIQYLHVNFPIFIVSFIISNIIHLFHTHLLYNLVPQTNVRQFLL